MASSNLLQYLPSKISRTRDKLVLNIYDLECVAGEANWLLMAVHDCQTDHSQYRKYRSPQRAVP